MDHFYTDPLYTGHVNSEANWKKHKKSKLVFNSLKQQSFDLHHEPYSASRVFKNDYIARPGRVKSPIKVPELARLDMLHPSTRLVTQTVSA